MLPLALKGILSGSTGENPPKTIVRGRKLLQHESGAP
jgi:hypothetical protein